jgi:hypothetical protein
MGCEVGKGGQAGARKRWERQLSLLVVSRTSTAKRGTIVDSATPTISDASVGMSGLRPKNFKN